MDTSAPPQGKASRCAWIGLAVLSLPSVLYSMDLTVLNLAVPTLAAELRPSSSQMLWIVDVYGFLVAGFLVTMGALGDRIGRRRLLLIGAAAFGITSLLAAFARTADELIVARAALGIAGATLAPSTLSLIRNMFDDERERTTAIGIWVASYSVGAALGPLVGGVVLEHFGWGACFLIAIPVMVLLLALGPFLLPEFRDPAAGRIDLASAVLSLAATLSFVYGLKQLAEHGVTAPAVLSVSASAALARVFVRRQRTLADPMIDLRLFRVPAFTAALAGYALGCLAMFGVNIFVGQYLQLVLGLSALEAGWWTLPWALSFVVGSTFAPRLARFVAPQTAMVGGLALSAVGFAILALVGVGPSGLVAVVVGTSIVALGMAPLFTFGNDLIVGNAPPERAGSASALSETAAELAGAFGIAAFGSIGTAIYRRVLADGLPTELSSEVVAAASATLGGAVSVAEQLHEPARAAVLEAARGAFLDGMQVAALASTAIAIAAAVLVGRMLRASAIATPPSASEGDDADCGDRLAA